MSDWKSYIDQNGDFQLANFLYKSINDLMKHSLDMGTLLSNDQQKLRAYKEQTKKLFKNRWFDIARCLENFDVIEKCICFSDQKENYCDICKGARYKITSYLSADEVRDVSLFVGAAQDADVQEKLQKGLMKLLEEIS
jgi:hypothetical protein